MASTHAETARARGLLLVHQAGFDSTLAEVGAHRAREALREARPTEPPATCAGYLAFSGTPTLTNGTLLTALETGVGSRGTYAFPPTPSHLAASSEAVAPVMPLPPLLQLPAASHECPIPGVAEHAKAVPMMQPDVPMINWSNAIRGEPQLEYAQYALLAGVRVPLLRKFALGGIGLLAVLASLICRCLPAAVGVSVRHAVVHLRGQAAGPTGDDVLRTKVTGWFECTGAEGSVGRVRVEVGEPYAWTAMAAVATAMCVLHDVGVDPRVPRTSGSAPPVGGLGEPLIERFLATGGMTVTPF